MTITVLVGVLGAVACSRTAVEPPPPSSPPRAAGCDVALFREESPLPADKIGPVSATCDEGLTEEACLRRLQDEVCRVGGDVAWNVVDESKLDFSALRWSAQAGHTRRPRD